MMLDLNLSIHQNNIISNSITSNSSIMETSSNRGDEEHSYSCSNQAYNFDILKKNDLEDFHEADINRSSKVATKQLFPTIRGGAMDDNRAFVLRQQQQQYIQQVKKSRRGPRSRSSQYRGVTFYRRTGRWESHIWLVD